MQKFYETTDHVMLCYVYTTRKLTVEDPKRSHILLKESQLTSIYVLLVFFLSPLWWHTLLSHASAEACLTGWPNAPELSNGTSFNDFE